MAMLGGECSACCGGWSCVKSCSSRFLNSLPLFDGVEVNIGGIETDTGPLGLRVVAGKSVCFDSQYVYLSWTSRWPLTGYQYPAPPAGVTVSRSSTGGKREWSLQEFYLFFECLRSSNANNQLPESDGSSYSSLMVGFFYGNADFSEGIFVGYGGNDTGPYRSVRAHYIGDANGLCEGRAGGILQTFASTPKFVLRYLTGEVNDLGTPIIAHRDLSATVDGMINVSLYRS